MTSQKIRQYLTLTCNVKLPYHTIGCHLTSFVRRLTCNNSMAYLKNWTDNFFQIFFMGTSWVAVSINNITTRASREMTSQKNITIFYFNGVNIAKHWHVAGEVFAISDCLVHYVAVYLMIPPSGNDVFVGPFELCAFYKIYP